MRPRIAARRLAAVILAVVAIAPAVAAADLPVRRFVTIGTGGPTGVYYAAGQAICRIAEVTSAARAATTGRLIRCQAPSTGGSRFNLSRVALGAFDFALAQSDWQYHSSRGTRPLDVKPFPGLRAVMSLHAEPFQIVVAADSGIASFPDLEDKRVGIGNPGSGQRGTMLVLTERYGMSVADFGRVSELTAKKAASALCAGETDAFVVATGYPAADVVSAVDGCGARILGLSGEVERRLVDQAPYYAFVNIPGGTYRPSERDVTTFGPVATLVTRANLDDATVYDVTRAIMERLEDLRAAHPVLQALDPARMTREGLTAPLHPGAERYYRERGWM